MAMGWLGKVRKGAPSAEPKRALAGLPCSMADKGGSLSGSCFPLPGSRRLSQGPAISSWGQGIPESMKIPLPEG